MKASELRIGNLVWNHVQGVAVPVDLRILGQMVAAEKGLGEVWRPIPLTEDWLIKFGFEKGSITHADKSITPISYKIDDNYRVQWFSNKSLSEVNTGELMFVSPKGLIRTIKYVHQLQNLYFALTGKELELN